MPKYRVEDLLKIAGNFKISRIILTANELNLFTFIHCGFNKPDELAKKIGLDCFALRGLLNALVSLKFLKKKKESYYNLLATNKFLVKGMPDYIGHSLLHLSNTWARWSNLTEAVKRGRPVRRIKDSPERAQNFTLAMCSTAKRKVEKVSGVIDFSGVGKFLDLGGGPGIYSIEFCRKNKKISGVLFDRKEVIKISREIIKKYGLLKRIKIKPGDFLKDNIGSSYDMVFLSSIVHIYPPEKNLLVFKKAYSALNPGGKAVISDFIVNREHTAPLYSVIFNLNMLTAAFGGRTYSYDEIKKLLNTCGFKRIKKRKVLDMVLIFGEK